MMFECKGSDFSFFFVWAKASYIRVTVVHRAIACVGRQSSFKQEGAVVKYCISYHVSCAHFARSRSAKEWSWFPSSSTSLISSAIRVGECIALPSLIMPRRGGKRHLTLEERISRKITWLLRHCKDFRQNNLNAEGFATLNSVITYLGLLRIATIMVIHRAIQNSNDDDGHPRFELRPFWLEHPSDITECVRVCNEESNQVRKWRLNNTRTPPASFWEEPWPETWEEPWQKYSQEESEQETSWHKTGQEKYHEERHDNWQKESQEDWQEKPLHKTWQEGSWQEESGKEGSWQERHDNWKQSWREGPGQEGSWQKEWQQTWQEGSGKEEWPKKSWQGKRQKPWQEQWGKEKTWENKDEDQDLSWKVEADPCWID